MVPPPTIPEPLWTFLYGRRQHRRHGVSCEAVLHGPVHPLACHIVDVSGGGMLIHVARSALSAAASGVRGGLVERNFGQAFRLELLEADIAVEAALARLAWRPGDDDHIYAGCRFPRTLDDRTLQRLGIEPELGPDESTGRPAATCMPLRADDGSPFTVVLHEAGEDQRVALYTGPLIAAGRNTLAAKFEDAGLDAVATAIDARNLVIAVHQGLDPMWTVRVQPMAVRPLPEPERGVEVVLLADSSPASLLTSRLLRTDDVA